MSGKMAEPALLEIEDLRTYFFTSDGIVRAVEEVVHRGDEFLTLGARETGIEGLLLPRRAMFVDREAELLRNRHERILVGGMQPAAADIEHHVIGERQGLRAPADPLARFQYQRRMSAVLQRMRGTKPRRARADDGDVDVRGEGHGGGTDDDVVKV